MVSRNKIITIRVAMQETAGAASDKAQDVAGSAKDKAQDAAGSAGDAARDARDGAAEGAQEAADVAGTAGEQANQAARGFVSGRWLACSHVKCACMWPCLGKCGRMMGER